MKVRELREQLGSFIEKNEEIVKAAEIEERDLTADEVKEFDVNEEEIEKLEARIKRQEKIEARAVADHSIQTKEPKEVREFKYMEFVRQASSSRGVEGLNKEIHEEAVNEARQVGTTVQGAGIPYSVLSRKSEKRDQTAGTTTEGGFTVQTDIDGQNFIDALKDRTVLIQAGATMLTGLQGDVAFPKFTELAFAWETETSANAETSSTVSQVTMAPERVGGFVDISKRLMLQSSMDIESYIRGELTSGVSRALQQAAINGAGSGNEPTGILTLTPSTEIEVGTNGGPITWDLAVQLESEANATNAPMGRSGYVTNSKVLGDLKTISKDSGSGLFLYELDQMNGHPVYVTNQVPSNLTKGSASAVCSAIIYSSDWAELMMGMWGGLDLLVDPYTQATANIVRLIVNLHADVAVKNETAFSFIDDLTTTA